MKKIIFALIVISLLGLSSEYVWFNFLSAPGDSVNPETFTVPKDQQNNVSVQSLGSQKFIRNATVFQFILDNFSRKFEIKPGGYTLTRNMTAWQVMKKVTGDPDLVWVTTSYCLRKEQVGEILADNLNWSTQETNDWNGINKNTRPEYYEGVYYPDTYLLPVKDTPSEIADRYINHFNEKLAPLVSKFAEKNIKWTTGVKIASLIAREAAGTTDMKLISGIIWNRLNTEMPLQIDATMAYTLGKTNGSWWANIDVAQKRSDSPYNTYKVKGLPPTPICSPNIDAIEAALNPETTDCLFYLHDADKQIHCAKTYAEHKANIDKYLRG